jgi:hypothetical protein
VPSICLLVLEGKIVKVIHTRFFMGDFLRARRRLPTPSMVVHYGSVHLYDYLYKSEVVDMTRQQVPLMEIGQGEIEEKWKRWREGHSPAAPRFASGAAQRLLQDPVRLTHMALQVTVQEPWKLSSNFAITTADDLS